MAGTRRRVQGRWLAICVLVFSAGCHTGRGEAREPFPVWVEQLRAEALQEGISAGLLDEALHNLTPDPRVIRFDRSQPEFVQTFDEYLKARLTEARINEGKRLLRRHRDLLAPIAQKYGVGPSYLVAFWGLESGFGRHQGTYSVIRSLATLAYDTRRSSFFRRELISALKILQEGHIRPDRMVGGWAG
ncbi:MAG: lytic murein transglycosylase, partial [Dehalococcoidia bacterium]|nr:lytic murein transglycosylase [Dehalococcoidia bacterium]